MKSTRTISRLCFGLTAGMAIIAIILRTVAFFTSYDAKLGYFNSAALRIILYILCGLAVVGAAVCARLSPKNTLPADIGSIAGGGQWLAICPAVGFALFLCLSLVKNGFRDGKLSTFIYILALGSVAYFLCTLLGLHTRRPALVPLVALIGFCPVFWGIGVIAQSYIDMKIAMNSPLKTALQFGCIGLMLLLCAELRYLMSHPAPRLYLLYNSIGLFFCLYASVPYLIAWRGGILDQPRYPLWSSVLLFAGIYAGAHLFQFVFLTPLAAPEENTENSENIEILPEENTPQI